MWLANRNNKTLYLLHQIFNLTLKHQIKTLKLQKLYKNTSTGIIAAKQQFKVTNYIPVVYFLTKF